MTFRREQPPPPPTPPSVGIMRALGTLLDAEDNQPIADLDRIASETGMADLSELRPLIRAGIQAGYLTLDEYGGVGLTEGGWAWYRHDADR